MAAEDEGTAVGEKTSGGCTVTKAEKKPPVKGGTWEVTVTLGGKSQTSTSPSRRKAEDQACSLLTA